MIEVLREEENYLPGFDLKEEGKYKLFKKSRVIKYVEDFEKAESMGVPWALASDIGGGPFLSMFDVMRSFVLQNREVGRHTATLSKALHRTTLKAAELMDLSADRGMLEVGYYLDAIRVPMPAGLPSKANGEAVLEALIRLMPNRESSDTFVNETIIRGKSCFSKEAVV